MRRVLVTGGTGFIGSNLARALVGMGCNVRILRRPESDLRAIGNTPVDHCIGDVRDRDSLDAAVRGRDTVFHTAGLVAFSRRKRELLHEVNVAGTRNVVEACLAAGVQRLVHTSSVAAVGYPPEGQLADERTAYNWGASASYRLSKHLAEAEVLRGIEADLDAVIVNPSVVVGEGDIHLHGGQIVVDTFRRRIPFYVKGGMNVGYVGDVVHGHILAAQEGRRGERYILGGANMTHKEIFTRTAELLGVRPPLAQLPVPLVKLAAHVAERAAEVMHTEPWIAVDLVAGAGLLNWYSSAKAREQLGYTISPFDRAILGAFAWYRQNGFL